MTFPRASLAVVFGVAFLAITAFKPLDICIGDSTEKVDSALGRRFEKVDAMKMTDSTRLYDRGSGKFLIAFKAREVCYIEYLGSFTEEDILALLGSAAPADKWITETPETTKDGIITRFYRTADSRLFARATDGLHIMVYKSDIGF
jgi:hypothetical protein